MVEGFSIATDRKVNAMLMFLNLTFFAVHNALIAFNMVGWIWPRTRRWHLVTIAVTLFSWLVMGAWYGWGYCLCTDWHFDIRRRLGIHQGETSYTELLFHQIPGLEMSRFWSDLVTLSVFVLILLATAWVWIRDIGASCKSTSKSGSQGSREPDLS